MNNSDLPVHVTLPEQHDFASVHAFANAICKQPLLSQSPVIKVHDTGAWDLSSADKPLSSSALHVMLSSPTADILTHLYGRIETIIDIQGFRFHPFSHWAVGQVGLVFCLSSSTAMSDKQTNALKEVANAFSAEMAVIHDGPSLNQKGLLVMDMDSTVIAVECIDEIAVLAGVGSEVSEVTERAMQGELDFAESLRSRVKCLVGLEESALEKVKYRLPPMPGLQRLVDQLHKAGWKVAIASGGFTYFSDHLKLRYNLDFAIANQLDIEDGKLTGNVVGDIVDANTKAETVNSLAQQWDISPNQTIAMGDGANDLVMMRAAKLGVAFRAKPIVQAQADSAINHFGLDALLCYLR